MALSKYFNPLTILLTTLLSSGCQHEFIHGNTIELSSIEFSEEIPKRFREKSKQYFTITKEAKNSSLLISKLTFKKRTLYGGFAARAKEIEVLAELHYEFLSAKMRHSGIVTASTQMPSNEANPQAEISAQMQLKDELGFILLENLLQEYWLLES